MVAILRGIGRGLLTLTAVALWAALAWGCLRNGGIEAAQGTLLLIAGTIAALMAGLDDIEIFKASATGVEAQMRATVQRAENAITEVQKLAKVTGMFMVDSMQAKQFIGSAPPAEQEARKQEILALLKELGLDERDIRDVSFSDKRWVRLWYENAITRNVPSNPLANDQWAAFTARFVGVDNRPPIDEIMAEVEAVGDADPRRTALADDLKFYLANGRHRRPHVWADRDNWHVELPAA